MATVDGSVFAGPAYKPIGGHILAHASTTRLQLRKAKGEERIAKLVDSPHMPEADARYMVNEGGVIDCE